MMLQATNITLRLGGNALLRNVDVTVRSRELLVIAGTNGAGKTTLLRVLSGEALPTSGEVTLDRQPLSAFKGSALAKRRAYLAQQTVCTLPFSAREIVLFGAAAAGHTGLRAHKSAEKCMKQSGTFHLSERLMNTLSGGEQQRVHWARVLAQLGSLYDGKCLFLDEPISSLDLAHQHELLSLARSFTREGGAVVAVLHDLNLAAEYADRILLLRQGSLVCEGKPWEVFTEETVRATFGLPVRIATHPVTQGPWIVAERCCGV